MCSQRCIERGWRSWDRMRGNDAGAAIDRGRKGTCTEGSGSGFASKKGFVSAGIICRGIKSRENAGTGSRRPSSKSCTRASVIHVNIDKNRKHSPAAIAKLHVRLCPLSSHSSFQSGLAKKFQLVFGSIMAKFAIMTPRQKFGTLSTGSAPPALKNTSHSSFTNFLVRMSVDEGITGSI